MIQEFVDAFMANKDQIRSVFAQKHPDEYMDVVRAVITAISGEDSWGKPDPSRIHQIDDGNYQGTLLFVIAANGYQPNDYWFVKVDYGSCSGCDTLQAICEYSSEQPTEAQVDQYMTLALHVVQGLKAMQ